MGLGGGPDGRRQRGGGEAVRGGKTGAPAQHSTAENPNGGGRPAASRVGGGD